MKTRNKFFMLLLSMGVVLSACTDSSTDDPDGPGQPADEYGYFALRTRDANIPGLTKNSPAQPDEGHTEDGLTNESKVKDIRVALYDAYTEELEYTFDYAVATDGTLAVTATATVVGKGANYTTPDAGYYDSKGILDGSTSNFEDGIWTEGEMVVYKDYKLLVLVNPTDEALDHTDLDGTPLTATGFKNATISGLTQHKEYEYFIGGEIETAEEFFMSNFQDFVFVPKTDLQQTKAAAETKPVKVYVDRAVAKVRFKIKNDDYTAVSTNNVAIVDNGTWALDVTNRTSYFMRHKTFTYAGNAEPTDEMAPVSRFNYYAIDPNYDDISVERNSTNSTVTRDANFNRITKSDVTLGMGATNYTYAFENTMEAAEQYEDVTTAAILKIDYKPTVTAVHGKDGFSESETEFASGLNKYYVWTNPTGKKFVFTGKNLNDILAMDETDFDESEFEDFKLLYDFLSESAVVTTFGTDFTVELATSNIVGANDMKLSWFADVTNYYRVLIRHFNDDQVPRLMGYGRYGMVRNNVYELTLNSISGPGEIDIPEPEGPDDKVAYIAVDIRVLPWIVRPQGVDL